MDKGNHFYKCDLQMHSPRDRGWKGGNCISNEDRKEYAKNFIKECRDADLKAIAITDHHDMVFYEYIKYASENELNDNGVLVEPQNRIIVFPGIEVTLHHPPMQGLLIFDANFPDILFPTVLGALSIAQAPKTDSKTIETEGIPSDVINGINALHTKLDATDGVKGRYVFLPHISESGHKTLMRSGFHEAYAKMPCVGGYVDGKFDGGGVGYMKVLNGEVDAYGFKSIAVVQTSDYRATEPLKDINIATWIKWKEPTAEALRQAFLAKESRISLVEPDLPQVYIEKIDVTNSVFLSKFNLNFNSQLNSIIGGRGSGKSTILEYLRWALCDQTEAFGNDDPKSEIERKRNALIEKTLKEVDGEVRVFFRVNGTRHIIKRNPKSEDVLLKVGDGDFQSVRQSQIQDLLPIQAYSQKQLSSISVRSDELKRFIERPIAKEIEIIDDKIEQSSRFIKTAYEKLSNTRDVQRDLKQNELEIDSYKKQIKELRDGLKGISETDKAIINRAKFYTNEKNRFDEITFENSDITENLTMIKDLFEGYQMKYLYDFISDENISQVYENTKIINDVEKIKKDSLENILRQIDNILTEHNRTEASIKKEYESWSIINEKFQSDYKEAKAKSSSSASTLASIKELEEKIKNLDLTIRKKKSVLSNQDMTSEKFDAIYKTFIDCQIEKTEMLKTSTELFTKLSDKLIKADFTKTIDAEKLTKDINNIFSAYSLNIPKAKVGKLAELISLDENPLLKWNQVIFEIKKLTEFNLVPEAQNQLPETPVLGNADFSVANKRKICESLSGDGYLRLATLILDFLPRFYYRSNNQMGDEIPFEDASAGQQATALLNVLLNQDGFPLIIDQPEDDIDNRAIEKIIKNLWNSKKKRQIIISSHNANLVVNGDSELVVCCDYNETSDQTKGYIKYEGSIDSKDIRDEIVSVMEGGERAFKLRKEKFGF